jgi:LysM repeat protein
MKRISFVLVALALFTVPGVRAQDAATEERLNQLSGKIEDLIAGQEAQRKRVAELSREIDSLREQQGKPNAGYASHEDLKRLADALKEVDRKRVDDNEKTRVELIKLGKILSAPPPPITNKKPSTPKSDTVATDKPGKKEEVAEYTIQSGDTLSVISQAYKEKNVKVSVEQILKANPGLKPEKMHVGQKIFVPLTQ